MSTWKVILAALVIFTAGVFTGGVTVRLYDPARFGFRPGRFDQRSHDPRERHNVYLDRLRQDLNLNSEQSIQISNVLAQSRQRVKNLFDQVGPKMQDEFRLVRDQIRGKLGEEQQKRFDELPKYYPFPPPPRPGPSRGRGPGKRPTDSSSAAPTNAAPNPAPPTSTTCP